MYLLKFMAYYISSNHYKNLNSNSQIKKKVFYILNTLKLKKAKNLSIDSFSKKAILSFITRNKTTSYTYIIDNELKILNQNPNISNFTNIMPSQKIDNMININASKLRI